VMVSDVPGTLWGASVYDAIMYLRGKQDCYESVNIIVFRLCTKRNLIPPCQVPGSREESYRVGGGGPLLP